ncbi:MAG: hypothetical protein LBN08_01615 [Lactobacillales bacterium]|jgi:hypothetical protein|nr:hypothetical protein [Lactobacillales bacterium]
MANKIVEKYRTSRGKFDRAKIKNLAFLVKQDGHPISFVKSIKGLFRGYAPHAGGVFYESQMGSNFAVTSHYSTQNPDDVAVYLEFLEGVNCPYHYAEKTTLFTRRTKYQVKVVCKELPLDFMVQFKGE